MLEDVRQHNFWEPSQKAHPKHKKEGISEKLADKQTSGCHLDA